MSKSLINIFVGRWQIVDYRIYDPIKGWIPTEREERPHKWKFEQVCSAISLSHGTLYSGIVCETTRNARTSHTGYIFDPREKVLSLDRSIYTAEGVRLRECMEYYRVEEATASGYRLDSLDQACDNEDLHTVSFRIVKL